MRVSRSPQSGSPQASGPSMYSVVEGDTLASIASKHNVDVKSLARANKISIETDLTLGQELTIPASRRTKKPDATAAWPSTDAFEKWAVKEK